ncbi:MAG: NUDIX domain-containing protein [Verrucomicrobiales bacterium]
MSSGCARHESVNRRIVVHPIRNILFDWSGTLVDDLPPVVHATNAVLRHCGKPGMTREEFMREFELPFERFYRRLTPDNALDTLEPIFHRAFEQSVERATPLPHALDFLNFCRATRRRCFVLSSAHPPYLERQAEEFGFATFFEEVYAGVRDKTQVIHRILETHALDARETVFIGDMTHDIEAARHGGIRSIAVLTGYQSAGALVVVEPDIMVRDLAHLRAVMVGHDPLDTTPVGTVGALIFNRAGRVLMLKTNKWSHRWGIPGGKIRRGEPSEAALRREVREETGLEIEEIRFVMVQDCVDPPEFHHSAHFLLLNYTALALDGEISLNDEAQAFQWVGLEEALELDLNIPTHTLILEVLQKRPSPYVLF